MHTWMVTRPGICEDSDSTSAGMKNNDKLKKINHDRQLFQTAAVTLSCVVYCKVFNTYFLTENYNIYIYIPTVYTFIFTFVVSLVNCEEGIALSIAVRCSHLSVCCRLG